MLRLRCPECLARITGRFEQRHVDEYDHDLCAGRSAIVTAYETLVRTNMEEDAHLLSRALALDLIGPDDFAPTGPRR